MMRACQTLCRLGIGPGSRDVGINFCSDPLPCSEKLPRGRVGMSQDQHLVRGANWPPRYCSLYRLRPSTIYDRGSGQGQSEAGEGRVDMFCSQRRWSGADEAQRAIGYQDLREYDGQISRAREVALSEDGRQRPRRRCRPATRWAGADRRPWHKDAAAPWRGRATCNVLVVWREEVIESPRPSRARPCVLQRLVRPLCLTTSTLHRDGQTYSPSIISFSACLLNRTSFLAAEDRLTQTDQCRLEQLLGRLGTRCHLRRFTTAFPALDDVTFYSLF